MSGRRSRNPSCLAAWVDIEPVDEAAPGAHDQPGLLEITMWLGWPVEEAAPGEHDLPDQTLTEAAAALATCFLVAAPFPGRGVFFS